MKKDISKIINYSLLALGLIVLIFFIQSLDFKGVIESLKLVGPRVIVVAICLMLTTVLVKTYRWKVLIKQITGKDIGTWFSFLSIFAGVSSASIFPGRNEITKPLMLKSTYNSPLSKTIPAALIEKIFDFIGLIMLFFLALIMVKTKNFDYGQYVIPFMFLAAFLILFLFVFPHQLSRLSLFIINKLPIKKFKKNLANFSNTFFESFESIKDRKVAFILFLTSFIVMIIEVTRLSYLFLTFGSSIPFMIISLAFTGSLLLGILTLIPGGIGVTEFSSATIIVALVATANANIVKTVIFLDRVIAYYTLVAVGAIILLFYQKIVKKPLKSKQ